MKSVAKGMVVGKVRGGGDLIVGGGDGGTVTPAPSAVSGSGSGQKKERFKDDVSMSGGRESPEIVGYGRQAPPAYGSGVGETIEGQRVSDVKR